MTGDDDDACERARELLMVRSVEQQSINVPPEAPRWYIKNSTIQEIFREFPVRKIFLCSCSRCIKFADLRSNDNRKDRFDEHELLNKYARIYALLIHLRYASLISLFRKRGVYLGEDPLYAENLGFLNELSYLSSDQRGIIRKEILRDQYCFFVKTFTTRNEITFINKEEALAIKEDAEPIGKGDFGEVYALEIPVEYMDTSLQNRVNNLQVSLHSL